MDIYCCWRDFAGFGFHAVVSAETSERAIGILGWYIDEDTTEIKAVRIGVADQKVEKIWCEEDL